MSDELKTFGVKLSNEVKEKLHTLIDQSGLSGRQFIENLVANYETSKLEQQDNDVPKEIKDIEHHLLRVKELFIGKLKDVEDYRQQYEFLLEESQQKHLQVVANLNEQIAGLKLQFENEKKSVVEALATNSKLAEKNNELEEINRGSVKTISLYENSLENLKCQIDELKVAGEQYQAAQQENIELKASVKDLGQQIENNNRAHGDKIKDMEISHERHILGIQSEHTQELREIQNNYNKEISELRQRYDGNIENKAELLEKARNELNVVKEEKYSLQAEFKSLQVQIDLLKQQINNE